jgi:hypothetical protein
MKTEKRTCPTCQRRKPAAAFGDSTSCRVCVVTGRAVHTRSLEEVRRMRKVFDRLHIGTLVNAKKATEAR